jgi:hypothetical protein
LVNVISDNALLIAFSETSRHVTITHVREACNELSLPTPPTGVAVPAGPPQNAFGSPGAPIPDPPKVPDPPKGPDPLKVIDPPTVLGPPKLVGPPKVTSNGIVENGDGPNLWLEKQQPSLLRRWMRLSK